MVAPDHEPTVLFPCGHTFCRACLRRRRSAPKCPLCRQAIQSSTVNVPLRDLIASFACPGRPSGDDDDDAERRRLADRYLLEYRTMTMRTRVLVGERRALADQSADLEARERRAASLDEALARDAADAQARLERARRDLERVEVDRARNADERERVRRERERVTKSRADVDAALRPLRVGVDKSRLLLLHFQPDAVLSDEDEDI